MQPDKLEEYVIPPYRMARTFYHTQEQFKYARAAFYRYIDQESPESILDVGCGTGLDAQPITKRGASYVGVDPIEQNLTYARKDNPGYEFKIGYAQELPFDDNSFEWIFMCGVWENLPDIKQMKDAMRECIRVAQSKVVVLDCHPKPRFMADRYMSVPMDYGLTIRRVNYDPVKHKANYMWIVDLEGIQ
jgi:ubiquinone/menaquinone biosynthesis C-methylase UbiE